MPSRSGALIGRRRVRPLLHAQAAVVRREHDQGAIGQFQFVELFENAADAVVETFDHGGVNRIALLAGPAALVLRDQLRLRLQGNVNGVVRQIEEERLVAVALDEFLGLRRQPVGEIFAIGGVLQPRHEHALLVLVGSEITARRAGRVAGDVDVEAALLRQRSLAAEVPFADVAGGVSGLPQLRGNRRLAGRQLLIDDGTQQFLIGPIGAARQPVGEIEPGRILAGHERGACRRADRTSGVGIGETLALRGEAIEVRRLVILAAVAAEIGPTEIVGEDDNNVGPDRILGLSACGKRH